MQSPVGPLLLPARLIKLEACPDSQAKHQSHKWQEPLLHAPSTPYSSAVPSYSPPLCPLLLPASSTVCCVHFLTRTRHTMQSPPLASRPWALWGLPGPGRMQDWRCHGDETPPAKTTWPSELELHGHSPQLLSLVRGADLRVQQQTWGNRYQAREYLCLPP